MFQLYQDRPRLVLFIILANIALSLWCWLLDPVINIDGIIYISVAELFFDGQFSQALEHFSWPFYPFFIACIAKITTLDVETSAMLFNTLLIIATTLAFVCIVSLLSGNNQRIVFIATIIILLFPSISKYRTFIIRDFGYLSCYLWSLYFILRYCTEWKKQYLLGWLLFAGLSSLFRFEGIIFLLVAPYFLFLFKIQAIPHRKKLLLALSTVLLCSSAALIYWYINDKYTDSIEVARLSGKNIQSFYDLLLANLQSRLGEKPLTLVNIFHLIFSSFGDVTKELIRRMAIFYLIFAVYAYVTKLAISNSLQRKIWFIYIAINIVLLCGFSFSNSFFVSRYTMATVLTILIFAPFTVDYLLRSISQTQSIKKIGAYLLLILLALVSFEGLDVRTNKHFVKDAGVWVKENLQDKARIYSNDKIAMYYARRGPKSNLDKPYSTAVMKQFTDTEENQLYDYFILVGTGEFLEDLMRQTLWYRFGRPVKMFEGEDKRFAYIFKLNKRILDKHE